MKTIKELEEMRKCFKKLNIKTVITNAEINTLKDVIELINERIKDLRQMLECDEPLMWETSRINWKQAEAIIRELEELKARIKG